MISPPGRTILLVRSRQITKMWNWETGDRSPQRGFAGIRPGGLTPSRRPSRSGENQMIFSAEKVRLMQRSGPASGHRATAEPIGTSGRSGVLPPIHGLPGGLRRNRHLPPAARLR